MTIIDVDQLMNLLIPFEGKIYEFRILENGKVRLMKTDGTSQIISASKLRKKKEKKRRNHHKGWTSF